MEIGVADLERILRQRWKFIIVFTAALITITGLFSYFVLKPEYETTLTLIIQGNRQGDTIAYNDLVTNQILAKSYGELLKNQQIAEEVIQKMNLPYTAQALMKKIKIKVNDGSMVATVSVSDSNPVRAINIANEFAQTFIGNLNSKLHLNNILIFNNADDANTILVQPKPIFNMSISLVLGLMMSLFISFLMELLNKFVKTEHDAVQLLDSPCFSVIATFDKSKRKRLICRYDPKSPIAEAYRTLRTNIQFYEPTKHMKSLMVTSTLEMEGKTTTITNLAIAMQQAGHRVLLMDGDLRKPMVDSVFYVDREHGLADYLYGQADVNDIIVHLEEGLDVILAGTIPKNPSELLSSKRMGELMTVLMERYDMVLLDSPPILSVTDGQILASKVDGVLLVLKSGNVRRDDVKKAKSLLAYVGANVIGSVLNNKEMDKQTYYKYYGTVEE